MKFKLAIIYLLIFSTLTGIGYISYRGLNHLMKTLSSNLHPDTRQKQFKDLLSLMHTEENNMRLYNITHLNDYLLVHKQTVKDINDKLSALRLECEDDSTLLVFIDSLDNYFQRKAICQEQLIQLKRIRPSIPGVMNKVLAEVDSLKGLVNRKSDSLPDGKEGAIKANRKKGLFSWLFPQNKGNIKNINSVDSVQKARNDSIELTEPIKKTFEEFSRKDSTLKQELLARDLEFTRENDVLSRHISEVTDSAISYVDVIHAENARSAGVLFVKTSKYIAVGGAVSAILLMIMLLVITHDFRIIIKTKKELETAKQRAEQLAKAKEEFLANMSHEIRTPLNAVIGFSKYLKDEKLSSEGEEYLNIISKSSVHLLRIINEILDFSKLDAGRMKLEKVSFNAYHLIEESTQAFRKEAEDKDLKLISEIDDELKKHEIISDPYRIRQVLNNLISNAIKFTAKGYVEIFAFLDNDSILHLTVQDSGCGIEKGYLTGIFEKFSQADNSTTRKYGGTGLGLSIVKKITELMGGKIDVDSVINRGSTFSLSIPVINSLRLKDSEPRQETGAMLENLSVLVIDDDPYNLILLKKILSGRKASVKTAGSGREAKKFINENNFNILIVDIHMPEMNGYEIIENAPAGTPAIAISA